MPQTDWGWLITETELRSWILHEDDSLLVVNKPGLVVCHPSKHGPWSSLVGACREYLGVERLHMPSRLDRETSGVVVLAKSAELGSVLQRAIEHRQVEKVYHSLLCGHLNREVAVDQPIGKAEGSAVWIKRGVASGGQEASTVFTPLEYRRGMTLARIAPRTGRLHQIRVHASWLGLPIAGDKIYGPDERLFLEFREQGWTPRHAAMLPFPRQALHASEWRCPLAGLAFSAPLPREEWNWSVLLEEGRAIDPLPL